VHDIAEPQTIFETGLVEVFPLPASPFTLPGLVSRKKSGLYETLMDLPWLWKIGFPTSGSRWGIRCLWGGGGNRNDHWSSGDHREWGARIGRGIQVAGAEQYGTKNTNKNGPF